MVGGKGGHAAPGHAATVDEFVARLRQLKERSGLTFRKLEERAAAHGDLLPRSTVADVLRRSSLPRPELVAALVRTCGGTSSDVAAWLAQRDRLAQAPDASAVDQRVGPTPALRRFRFPSTRDLVVMVVAVAAGAAVGAAVGSNAWLAVWGAGCRTSSRSSPASATTGPVLGGHQHLPGADLRPL